MLTLASPGVDAPLLEKWVKKNLVYTNTMRDSDFWTLKYRFKLYDHGAASKTVFKVLGLCTHIALRSL